MIPQTILIVDDTPANLQVLFTLLSEAGFEVAIAENGEMALETLSIIEPQLILLDVMMPGLNGYETCQKIKENPKTAAIPVIFMSALSESINKVRAFEIGAVDYITKPIDVAETLARVHHHLELKLAQAELAALNRELEGRVARRTEDLQAEIQERRQAEARFRSIFKLAPIGMAIADPHGRFLEVNQSLCDTLGYEPAELIQLSWRCLIHPEDRESVMELYRQAAQGEIQDFSLESRCLSRSNTIIHGLLQVATVRHEEALSNCFVCQFLDITLRKQAEAELRHSASHDNLTGLPNRALICQRLDTALLAAKQDPEYRFAVLFLDLNRFKMVNDSLGHQVAIAS
ncbi:MAG: response regulator [Synechococcales cyanobacterium RM1_1_8]|nr:response regulator [Synechococcales cyanobacterium RM1_1_8]